MADTEIIPPALTAEEWAWAYGDGIELEGEDPDENGRYCPQVDVQVKRRELEADRPSPRPDDHPDDIAAWHPTEAVLGVGESSMVGETHAFSVMALLNSILPDGDPRKITQEDVELIHAVLRNSDTYEEHVSPLRALAAKLAALLPPA